jgi:hypothetical protein
MEAKGMPPDFASIPPGPPVPGSKKIALKVWGKESRWKSALKLDRRKYGLVVEGGTLIGFENWLAAGLAAEARAGGHRRRERAAASGEAAPAS